MTNRKHTSKVTLYQEIMRRVVDIASATAPKLPYHNIDHALEHNSFTLWLAREEGLSQREQLLLGITALLHDIVYVPGAKDNEEKSALFAYSHLLSLGMSEEDALFVADLIYRSALITVPETIYEQIILDADTVNFGQDDFWTKNENVRSEMKVLNDIEWFEYTLDILNSHSYYTSTARTHFSSGKRQNVARLKKKLDQLYNDQTATFTNPSSLQDMNA